MLACGPPETVAMGTVGTSFGALLAVPICMLAARNVTPSRWLYYPARGLLNALRGIDSFVFALIFVAAVGLGPFAGVLGVALHARARSPSCGRKASRRSSPARWRPSP